MARTTRAATTAKMIAATMTGTERTARATRTTGATGTMEGDEGGTDGGVDGVDGRDDDAVADDEGSGLWARR